MSLVVAKDIVNQVHIVSDSRISEFDIPRRSYLAGAIKTIVLRSSLCISYAGTVRYSQDAINGINQNDSLDDICECLLLKNKDSNDEVEFIVASCMPNNIIKISGGEIIKDLSSAWIGDNIAFEKYQKYSSKISSVWVSDRGIMEIIKMVDGMRFVMEDPIVDNVGGFLVHVVSRSEKFEYLPSTNVDLRDLGGFLFNILVSYTGGIGVIGIYFPQIKLGALYYPIKLEKPKKYYNVTYEELVEKVKNDFGVILLGFKSSET